jgi:hypothetical protein
MRGRASVEELSKCLKECDDLLHAEPARALQMVGVARTDLDQLKGKVSDYKYRCLRMWADGLLGSALLATGRSQEAMEILASAKSVKSVAPVERASLALRLAHLYAHRSEWDQASEEADLALRQFVLHPPRPQADGRSYATALVTRSIVLQWAYAAGAKIPGIRDLVTEAAEGYRAALKKCTAETPRTTLAALLNLNSLAVPVWWQDPHGHQRISPGKVAASLKNVCQKLRRQGFSRKSRPHAQARWLLGVAIAESFEWLNKPAEEKLLNALADLLELGAIEDAARLCLDMCYLYYRESRWDDMAIVTATVLHHVQARGLPKSWYEALLLWQVAIEKGETAKVFVDVFEKIRGFRIRVPRLAVPSGDVHVPRQRYGDRADTGGL